SIDSSLDFDLDLVKARSQDNPVYYVQYAYARIASILRYGAEQGIALSPVEEAPLAELVHDSEIALARMLGESPETIEVCGRLRAPYRLTTYDHEPAAAFHPLYRACRVTRDDAQIPHARRCAAQG